VGCNLELQLDDKGIPVKSSASGRNKTLNDKYLCVKGFAIHELVTNKERLKHPLVRKGGKLVKASWDEAFKVVEEGLTPIIEKHGRDAVGVYLGNPCAHTMAGSLAMRPLLRALGGKSIFSASTVDQMPKHLSAGLMFGHADSIPVPDIDRTDYLLMLGADPLVSNGSLATAPDWPGRITALQERGGKLVVVDPRRITGMHEIKSKTRDESHVIVTTHTDARGRSVHFAGFAWAEADEITTREQWEAYLTSVVKEATGKRRAR